MCIPKMTREELRWQRVWQPDLDQNDNVVKVAGTDRAVAADMMDAAVMIEADMMDGSGVPFNVCSKCENPTTSPAAAKPNHSHTFKKLHWAKSVTRSIMRPTQAAPHVRILPSSSSSSSSSSAAETGIDSSSVHSQQVRNASLNMDASYRIGYGRLFLNKDFPIRKPTTKHPRAPSVTRCPDSISTNTDCQSKMTTTPSLVYLTMTSLLPCLTKMKPMKLFLILDR